MFLFNARFLQNNHDENSLEIRDAEFTVFVSLLRYLYTDHLRVPPHVVRKLEALAQKYRLPRLVILCKQLYAATEEKGTQNKSKLSN